MHRREWCPTPARRGPLRSPTTASAKVGDLQAQGPRSLRPRSAVSGPTARTSAATASSTSLRRTRQAAKPACRAANSCRRGSEEPRPAGGLDNSTGENKSQQASPLARQVGHGAESPSGNMTPVARLTAVTSLFRCRMSERVLRRPPHPYRAPVPYPPGVSPPHLITEVTARVSGNGRAERLIAVSANSGVSLLGPEIPPRHTLISFRG